MLETHQLPSFDINRLPGAIPYQTEDDEEGTPQITHMIILSDATIAQLKQGIAIQQAEVSQAAIGLQDLTSLLNRRLMQGAQDADPAWLESEDDAFRAKVHEHIGRESARFHNLMQDFDFDAHIDAALAAGRSAYADAQGDDVERHYWALINVDRKTKPLIQALQRRRIGRLDPVSLTYDVGVSDIVNQKRRSTTSPSQAVQSATIEAFALKLSEPGFEIEIFHQDS